MRRLSAVRRLLAVLFPERCAYCGQVVRCGEGCCPRCAESLLKLFEYMIRMDVTEAACVTHGGVIMSMLSQRALPSRRPEQWMADPGCGYTVQTDVQLWMRDKLVEAIDIVPFGYADTLRGQAETEENEAYE